MFCLRRGKSADRAPPLVTPGSKVQRQTPSRPKIAHTDAPSRHPPPAAASANTGLPACHGHRAGKVPASKTFCDYSIGTAGLAGPAGKFREPIAAQQDVGGLIVEVYEGPTACREFPTHRGSRARSATSLPGDPKDTRFCKARRDRLATPSNSHWRASGKLPRQFRSLRAARRIQGTSAKTFSEMAANHQVAGSSPAGLAGGA